MKQFHDHNDNRKDTEDDAPRVCSTENAPSDSENMGPEWRKSERRDAPSRSEGLRGLWEERRLFDRRRHEYSIFGNKLDESELPIRDIASVNQSLEARPEALSAEALSAEALSAEALSAEALSPAGASEELVWEDLSAEIEEISEEKMLKVARRSKRDTR